MKRREFNTLVGGVATWPIVARVARHDAGASRHVRDARRRRGGAKVPKAEVTFG
jgi:hypothetical protein